MPHRYDDDDENQQPLDRRSADRRRVPHYEEESYSPPPLRRRAPQPDYPEYEEEDYAPPPRRRRAPDPYVRRPARDRAYPLPADDDDDPYAPYDAPYGGRGMAFQQMRHTPTGNGCATATLYVVLGTLAAIALILFFFNNMLGGVGSFFTGTGQMPALIASPTPTISVNGPAVVQRIQSLSRLETTSYTIEQVIDAGVRGNVFENLLFGDSLLLIARGKVTAGLDLSQMQPQDVTVSPDGKTVTVQLPPVQILSANLDSNATRVYDRQTGIFAEPIKDLETEARREAESRILQAACEDGILQRASEDSRRAMEQFLSLLDVDQVIVQAAPVPTCPTN